VPWIALGCGYRRAIASCVSRGPECSATFDTTWNYDQVYSWMLGAELNSPFYAAHPDVWAPWDKAPAVLLYPGPFDYRGVAVAGNATEPPTTSMMAHFVAYVKGAANITEGFPSVKTEDDQAVRESDLRTQTTDEAINISSGRIILPVSPLHRVIVMNPAIAPRVCSASGYGVRAFGEAQRDGPDVDHIDIAMARSENGGCDWSEMLIIAGDGGVSKKLFCLGGYTAPAMLDNNTVGVLCDVRDMKTENSTASPIVTPPVSTGASYGLGGPSKTDDVERHHKLPPACVDDNGCELNGRCSAGVCVCDPGWRGPHCGTVRVILARICVPMCSLANAKVLHAAKSWASVAHPGVPGRGWVVVGGRSYAGRARGVASVRRRVRW
jgi:hypothetical protein